MTVYNASKEFGIPWTTLKDNVRRAKEERDKGMKTQFIMSKIGRPFTLPVELEQKLVAYIIEMQELGFGFTHFRWQRQQILSIALAQTKVLLVGTGGSVLNSIMAYLCEHRRICLLVELVVPILLSLLIFMKS